MHHAPQTIAAGIPRLTYLTRTVYADGTPYALDGGTTDDWCEVLEHYAQCARYTGEDARTPTTFMVCEWADGRLSAEDVTASIWAELADDDDRDPADSPEAIAHGLREDAARERDLVGAGA